jgi:hypothetical protein
MTLRLGRKNTYIFIEAVVSSTAFWMLGAEACRVIGSDTIGVELTGVPGAPNPLSAFSNQSPLPCAGGSGGSCARNGGKFAGWVEADAGTGGGLNRANNSARLAEGVPALGTGAGAGTGVEIGGGMGA